MSVFFQNSENVTNVKSVCNDGIIITHKIFIARNSEFIKHILIDIPIGDVAVPLWAICYQVEPPFENFQIFPKLKPIWPSEHA